MSFKSNFVNSLSGILHIDLSVPAHLVPHMYNLQSPSDAKVAALKLTCMEVYNDATEESHDLTADELDSVAFLGSEMRLRGLSGGVVSHKAPNGVFFTVRELLLAVEETERQTRNDSEWLGGVDIHHVFFEGIHEDSDGVWRIRWGS